MDDLVNLIYSLSFSLSLSSLHHQELKFHESIIYTIAFCHALLYFASPLGKDRFFFFFAPQGGTQSLHSHNFYYLLAWRAQTYSTVK